MKINIKLNIRKEYLLYISFSFILFFVLISLNTYVNSTKTFTFTNNSDFSKELEEIKNELLNLEENDCKVFINEYISEIDDKTIEGEYPIGHLFVYNNDFDILKLYDDGNTKCNIDEYGKKKIASNYLSIMANRIAIITPYLYQYELGFNIKEKNKLINNNTSLNYLSIKSSELNILREYMSYLRGGLINE